MAKKRKTDFSNHGWGVAIDLPQDIMDKLDSVTDGEMDKALVKALYNSSREFKDSIARYMDKSNHPYGTGRTLESLIDVFTYNGQIIDPLNPPKEVSRNGVISATIGFDIARGQGLPALFLDLGTPTIKPTYFMYYALNNSYTKIRKIQSDTIKDFMRGR